MKLGDKRMRGNNDASLDGQCTDEGVKREKKGCGHVWRDGWVEKLRDKCDVRRKNSRS